jgi:hypothetical protein
VQDQFANGRRGITLLLQGAQGYAALFERLDHVEQCPKRAPQAVQPYHGERVAWTQVVQ